MKIKIESGTYKIDSSSWVYNYTDVEGIHSIVFLVPEGKKPEIGDFIEDGVWKKRQGWQINPDVSRWKDKWHRFWGND